MASGSLLAPSMRAFRAHHLEHLASPLTLDAVPGLGILVGRVARANQPVARFQPLESKGLFRTRGPGVVQLGAVRRGHGDHALLGVCHVALEGGGLLRLVVGSQLGLHRLQLPQQPTFEHSLGCCSCSTIRASNLAHRSSTWRRMLSASATSISSWWPVSPVRTTYCTSHRT